MKKLLVLLSAFTILSCQGPAQPAERNSETASEVVAPDLEMHPEWTAQSSIYEVNLRQHTPEGTINSFEAKLPEIKKLGVEIL